MLLRKKEGKMLVSNFTLYMMILYTLCFSEKESHTSDTRLFRKFQQSPVLKLFYDLLNFMAL